MANDFDPAYLRAATDELRRAGLDRAADWMLARIDEAENTARFMDEISAAMCAKYNVQVSGAMGIPPSAIAGDATNSGPDHWPRRPR